MCSRYVCHVAISYRFKNTHVSHVESFSAKLYINTLHYILFYVFLNINLTCTFFEQKCLLMLITVFFIYFSTTFIYFYIHIHVRMGTNRIFGVLEVFVIQFVWSE